MQNYQRANQRTLVVLVSASPGLAQPQCAAVHMAASEVAMAQLASPGKSLEAASHMAQAVMNCH